MRYFNLFSGLSVQSLCGGGWRFKIDENDIGNTEKWYLTPLSNSSAAVVPSCWNNDFGLFDYEGIAWYQKDFIGGGNIKLQFDGIANEADVYLDGEYLGNHYGAFTSFSFIKKNLSEGKHSLTVRVDNTHNMTNSIPLSAVDWYHYGGIIREVKIISVPNNYIESIIVSYNLSKDLTAASVTLNISSVGDDIYSLLINGEEASQIHIQNGYNSIKLELNDIQLWDTENPYLYMFTLKKDSYEISERTGFRKIEAKNNKIYLNNKAVFVKGVNRHEEHPDWGFAVPEKLGLKDLQIIKSLGCNMIRGSHYPNSQYFLDLCDEEGILFWSEIPLWQYHEEQIENDALCRRAYAMTDEMISQYYNHPSIIIWSMHNECKTDTDVFLDFTKKMYLHIKELDSSRLVTYATNKVERDICLKWCDVISLNKYHGWYEGSTERWDTYLSNVGNILKNIGRKDVPVIMSEFGAAGIYGDCTLEGEKWSENYQADCIEKSINAFIKYKFIAGTIVWQYSDIRVCLQKSSDRARSFNNKGILNEYRKPKMSYYKLKEIYSKL